MCGAVACWSSLLSHLSQPCVSRHVSCHWDVSQAPSVSAPTVRLSWAVVGNNVRSRDRMITCPPSVVWDRHRDKVKSNFIFLLLSDWQGLWDWKFVWSWEYLISTPRWNLRVVTASWITAEFVKIWTKSNKGCGSVCRSHLHPFNFKKQEEDIFIRTQSISERRQTQDSRSESPQSTVCQTGWSYNISFIDWLYDHCTQHSQPSDPAIIGQQQQQQQQQQQHVLFRPNNVNYGCRYFVFQLNL